MFITITVKIIWFIKDHPDYGFGDDKCLYNLKRCKKIKQIYNNSCIGYKLNSKFVSLKNIKPLLYKPIIDNNPFKLCVK